MSFPNILQKYSYVPKEIDPWQSIDSPFENKITVGGCSFNSLVDHPYKDALGRFGVPVGLILSKGGVAPLNATTLTRDMVIHGGSAATTTIHESVYDELFHKVSHTPPRRLTRKNRG
jgi:hypothetical protein